MNFIINSIPDHRYYTRYIINNKHTTCWESVNTGLDYRNAGLLEYLTTVNIIMKHHHTSHDVYYVPAYSMQIKAIPQTN